MGGHGNNEVVLAGAVGVRGVAFWGEAEASPLEIGEGAPLELEGGVGGGGEGSCPEIG